MTTPRIQCSGCVHLHQYDSEMNGPPSCNAFPHGIPQEILWGAFDHRLPHDGDNGIRYQPLPVGDPAILDLESPLDT